MLTVIDAFTRLFPAIDVRTSYRGADVVATLEPVCRVYGKPGQIRVENGPEFISKDLYLWAYLNGHELDSARPGKPTDNALVESFNGKVTAECLNQAWFLSLEDARSTCEAWRIAYNRLRPHSAIGQKNPAEHARASGQACLT